MDVTVDLYKELQLDRSWDEKTIRQKIKELNKFWVKREAACNDKEQLLIIDRVKKNIDDALKYLTRASMRQQYDKALEKAYKNHVIRDEAEEKLVNLIDQARAYYRKGDIQMATKYAQQAIDGNINSAEAYELLANCYYDANNYSKALTIVDQGISTFGDNIQLHWLGARIAAVGINDYENAQERVNKLIELAPDRAIGHSEQVNLHLLKGDEKLAFEEIDSYISSHPDDTDFKREVAYNLGVHSLSCFYHDEKNDSRFLADKKSYEKCLSLRQKAYEIHEDEHMKNLLENALYYGRREWNSWNLESIKTLAGNGSLFTGLGIFLWIWSVHERAGFESLGQLLVIWGVFLLAIMGVLIYFSFRPYWLINQTYVTGKEGRAETIINFIGKCTAKLTKWFWKILVFLVKAFIFLYTLFIKFIIWICTGGFFK